MLYSLLRPVGGLALRLYYRRIESTGLERIPDRGPALLVVNHPNALVDAMVVGLLVPRRVHMTAKATLFVNPIRARLLRSVGVIPLRRAKDEAAVPGAANPLLDPGRNAESFRAILDTLAAGRVLMIFPEGISHDAPAMAPLRTGAARMALAARDTAGVRDLSIVPVGLVFSQKDAPRSHVLVEVGEPIRMDVWTPADPAAAVAELTAEIAARLHAVTLNFASLDEATQATALAGILARLLALSPTPVDRSGMSLAATAPIARRLEQIRATLPTLDAATRDRVFRLAGDLEAFQHELRVSDLRLEHLGIELDSVAGARFVVRELGVVSLAGPAAVWGSLNHWLPFRLARALAMRSVTSAADPAMRTIVIGTGLVLVTYAVQSVAIAYVLGPLTAAIYLASLPISAEINLRYRERLVRAVRRARTFLRFRRHPQLQVQLRSRATALATEAMELNALLTSPTD